MKRVAQPSAGVTTALIYTRVSSDEQAREGVSLDAQLAECRRYAARHGWVIGGEYQDVLSGMRDDRRAYQGLLTDARRLRTEGRTVAVVVAALDRFGRNLLERVRCREELKRLGVPTHSVREGGEVSDIVANVLAAVAEEEVRRLGERVRATNRHITAAGWHHVGRAPWGYAWRAATEEERALGSPKSVLEIDAAAAPYVREAFDRLSCGDSIRSVANWLAHLPEPARAGRQMRYSGVHVILQLRTYIGQFEDEAPGRWPALVDPEVWQRARESIARHKHLPKQASRAYLLTGFLRCERCGARMSGWHQRGRPLRYRCMGNQQGAASPDIRCYHNMRCEQVDGPVLAEMAEMLEVLTALDPRLRAVLHKRWESGRGRADPDGAVTAIRRLELGADKARQRLTNAAVLLVDGTIDKAGYDRLRDKAQADLEAAEAEIARLSGIREVRPTLPPLDVVLAEDGSWHRVLAEGGTAPRREILAHLIRTATPCRLKRDTFSVDVQWTPLGEMLRHAVREAAACRY